MVPVGITVEGANILTRTLITFAQGALRSHPYLYREIQAVQDPDAERGLDAFDGGVLRPHRLLGVERDRGLLPQHHRRRISCPRPSRPTRWRTGIASSGAPRATSPSSPT